MDNTNPELLICTKIMSNLNPMSNLNQMKPRDYWPIFDGTCLTESPFFILFQASWLVLFGWFWMPRLLDPGCFFLRYLKQYPKIPPFLSKFASEATNVGDRCPAYGWCEDKWLSRHGSIASFKHSFLLHILLFLLFTGSSLIWSNLFLWVCSPRVRGFRPIASYEWRYCGYQHVIGMDMLGLLLVFSKNHLVLNPSRADHLHRWSIVLCRQPAFEPSLAWFRATTDTWSESHTTKILESWPKFTQTWQGSWCSWSCSMFFSHVRQVKTAKPKKAAAPAAAFGAAMAPAVPQVDKAWGRSENEGMFQTLDGWSWETYDG